MDEAQLAQKLHDEVFSVEANERLATEEEATPEESEPEPEAEPDEQEQQPEEEEPAEEEEVEAEPEGDRSREREEEETPSEDVEEPEDEEEEKAPTDEFYAVATDRIRYKTREETERGLREQANTIGRLGQEVGHLRREREQQAELVNQLQTQVQQAQQSRPGGYFAPSFDSATVERAIESIEENEFGPAVFIDEALNKSGNIGLAYAICDAWEEHNPIYARDVRRRIEQVEELSQQYSEPEEEAEPEPPSLPETYEFLVSQLPEVSEYEEQMQQVASEIPDDHWITRDLEHGNEAARLRALHTIYELAKGRSIGVAAAREQIKNDQKQKGATARRKAAVASGQASPRGSDTPKNNTARFLENMRADLRRQGLFAEQQ